MLDDLTKRKRVIIRDVIMLRESSENRFELVKMSIDVENV